MRKKIPNSSLKRSKHFKEPSPRLRLETHLERGFGGANDASDATTLEGECLCSLPASRTTGRARCLPLPRPGLQRTHRQSLDFTSAGSN